MVLALTQHCLKPSSSNSPSCPSTRDRMSSKPGLRQQSVKKTYTVSGRADTATARTDMTPLTSRGVPAKSLPMLSPESPRARDLEGKRTRRVVLMRRASEGSCSGSSRLSTVVELPGINTRRHSVTGTVSTIDESNLEVFVSPPLKRCSSFGDATAAHVSSSSFRTRERPLLMRRSGPGTTPIPPSSPRSSTQSKISVDVNNNRPIVKTSYGSSTHFELTLQKIEETKPHIENGFPSRPTRKVVQRKNAVSSMDRQYLGGVDYQEFRSSLEGRRYANISEMKPEYAEELLTHDEEDIGLQEQSEDEQLRQKCLKWLETLPQK